MNTGDQSRPQWLDSLFWDRLTYLETQHQRVQSEHENARRGLDRVRGDRGADLLAAWERYCEVIAELDRATAELETLRTRA